MRTTAIAVNNPFKQLEWKDIYYYLDQLPPNTRYVQPVLSGRIFNKRDSTADRYERGHSKMATERMPHQTGRKFLNRQIETGTLDKISYILMRQAIIAILSRMHR